MRTLLTTFLLLLTLHLPAQDFLEDLSRDLCNCVNERGYSKDDDSCYNETVDNYKEEIEGFYGDLENKTNSNMLNADMIFYFADCPVLAKAMEADFGMDLSKLPWLTEKKCKKGFKGKYRFTEPLSGEIATVEFTKDTYTESYTDEILKYSIEWEGCDAKITLLEGSGEGFNDNSSQESQTFNMAFKRGNKDALAGLIYLPVFGDIMPLPRFYTKAD